jgi:hypothetical protein
VVLGPLFPNSGSRSRPTFERSGIMGGKEKFPTSKYGIIFGYPFEGCTGGLDCERRRVVLGPLFLNSGLVLGPGLNGVGLWVEKKSSSLPNMESYLDTHLSVSHMVLIASEDVWFLGLFFSTSGFRSRPTFEWSGIMGDSAVRCEETHTVFSTSFL